MRKFLIFTGMISLLLVFLGSCVRPIDSEYGSIDLGNFNTGLEINYSMQNDEGFYESSVHINKHTVIGKLIYRVENDVDSGASLYLKYEMFDSWRIKETRAATALNNQSFPSKNGFIDPDGLPNIFQFDPALSKTEEIVIPLGILPEDVRGIYFAIVGYFERSSGSKTIEGYSFGPCVYFVPVRTNPDIEVRPLVKVSFDSILDLSRVTDYDWEITKEASPEAISNLKQGDSASVEYTLTATRLTPQATDTYTLTGIATVTNEGSLQAEQVGLKVFLLGKNGGDWVEIDSKTLIETSSNTTLAASDLVGIGKPFTFEFNPGYYSEVRILAEATDNWPEIVDDFEDHLIPISPSSQTFVDESASVIDMPRNLVEFEILGFWVDHTGTWPWSVSPWVLNNTSGGTKKYSIVITNVSAPPGSYTLTNDATLTENDTLTKREASARILVSTPEPQEEILTLEATVTGSFRWDREIEYDWEIEKFVSPETIYLGIGEDTDVTYTVNATRTLTNNATDTFSYTGAVEVGNSLLSTIPADIDLTISLLESSDGGTFSPVKITVTETLSGLNPGDVVTRNFDFSDYSFVEGYYYRVKADAVSEVVSKANTGALAGPISPNLTEYDMTATVNDAYIVPVGFDVTPDSNYVWPWLLSETPAATTYTFNIVNKEKETGEFKVPNTVTLVEDDTKQERSDDATVTINVPEDKDLEIANEHDMEWDQTKKYSWIIDKSVTPQSLTLDTGDSGTFNYTLVATRSVEETNIATLTGVATISNTGNTTLTNISVVITLKDANGTTIDSYSTSILSLTPGSEQAIPYSFEGFDPASFTADFKVLVEATDGASDTLETTQTVPSPSVTQIDENAYVQDTFDPFSVAGLTLLGNQNRDWQVTTASWTQSYSVSVANSGAAPGQYSLHNTAVIFGKDTNTKYDTDDETVTIIVPDTVTLEAEVEAEFFWNRSKLYSWEIDKEVNPSSITYDVDEFEKEINYTITATRTLESDVSEHSYQGAVTVTNSGLSEAQNVKLLIELQYYNGTNWITIETLPQVSLGNLASGSSTVHNFGPSVFTPVDVSAEHKITVVASADAPANTADDFYSSMLQITSSETTNATATLDDEFTYIPDGFQIVGTDPDPLPFRKELTDSAIVQFSITLRKFSFNGVGGITYEMGADAYISATVSDYMEGTYPGWCTQVNVSGISGPYTILDIYEGGAPSTQMAKINYILNRFRDGDYPGVDYRHIQIAIWAIMEDSLNWSSWRKMFDPNVPGGDRPLVQAIIDTAKDSFLPGCGDVVLMKALSADKQDVILEIVFPCEEEEFRLENTATLTSELQEIWDDAVVEIKLTPTDPEIWIGGQTAWGGNYEGSGSAWWYYFDTNGPATQDIYAGQKKVEGASVTYKNGKLTIVLGPDMRLQSVSESVKIQGYAEGDLPTSGPNPGHFTAKGTDLEVSVSPARYYAIHLDVEVKQ